jgi:hypothetical protein
VGYGHLYFGEEKIHEIRGLGFMFWVLVKKEIRLQRSNIYFALAVFLVWCTAFLIALLGDRPLGSRILTTGKLVQIIYYFFILPCLIVIVPMLIGSTCIAQERKLGTLEWQSTLPVSRRKRWIVKTGTSLILIIFFGGILSWICDRILVWNFQIHNFSLIWSETNNPPVPLRLKGLLPEMFSLLFFSMGIYISSLSRDPYRALMAGFGFLGLSFFVQRLIDPAGMLNPLSKEFPDYYIHLSALYSMIFGLSFVLLGMSFINYKPQKMGINSLCLQFIFWILMVNMAGYFALRVEFGITHYRRTNDHNIPGLTKLFGAPEIFFNHSFYALPNTKKMIGAVLTKQDQKRLSREEGYQKWEGGNIMEINVETGKIKQKINLYGNISGFHNKGSYYITEQPYHIAKYGKRKFMITRSGLILPVGFLNKFHSVPLSHSENLIPCPESNPWFPITIMSQKENPFDFNSRSFPIGRNIGKDLFISHIWDVKREENVTLLLKKQSGDVCYPIFIKEGIFVPWISTDEKWFSETSYAFPENWYSGEKPVRHKESIEIYNVDSQTTYAIQSDKKLLILANKGSRNHYYLRIKSLYNENNQLSVSPDGNYLAFVRIIPDTMIVQGKTYPMAFPKQTEIRLLELKSGKEILVDIIPPGHLSSNEKKRYRVLAERFLSGNSHEEYEDYDELTKLEEIFISMPVTAWSDDLKLAMLYEGVLHVYQKNSTSGKFEKLLILNILGDLCEGKPRPYDHHNISMAFWSNDLLLFMVNINNSIWKLDLRECNPEKKI